MLGGEGLSNGLTEQRLLYASGSTKLTPTKAVAFSPSTIGYSLNTNVHDLVSSTNQAVKCSLKWFGNANDAADQVDQLV